ncbi:MAG TPA: MarR family transcriptional regulator [Burkholderiaceae bacterium]|nr:MarR family transcriptional regulator [Burkholderiaceae bacterium]
MEQPAPLFSLQDFQVEDSVGYLLKRTRAMLTNAAEETLAEQGLDITQAQGSLLFMLSTGKYRTAADLARELCIDAASMKRMIDRLATRGLIQRQPSAQDRRLIDLHLTDTGLALAQQLPAVYVATLNKSFAGFSAEEVGFLKSLLRKLLANAEIVSSQKTT